VRRPRGGTTRKAYLQAAAPGLGTVSIGAFDDARAHAVLGMEPHEEALNLMPVGAPALR
jgi:nitroreductase